LSLIVAVLESYEVVRRQLLHLDRFLTADCELIVVDDGSNPSLEATCASVAKNFDFLLHHTNDRRPWTQPRARNIGASLAQAPKLLFFDIDHIITSDVLHECLNYEGDKLHWTRRPGVLDSHGHIVTDHAILKDHGMKDDTPSVHGNSFMIRAEVFRVLRGYDERFCGRYGGDDIDFNDRYQQLSRTGRARPAEIRGEGYYYPDPAFSKHLFHSLKRDRAERREGAGTTMPTPSGNGQGACPRAPPPIDSSQVEALLKLGALFRQQGHLSKSADYLQHAVKLRPDLADAQDQFGLTLLDLGKLDEALAACREALRLTPNSATYSTHVAIVLQQLDRSGEAQGLLEQALALDWKDALAHAQYGTGLYEQGRAEEARKHFLKALSIRPDFAQVYFALAGDPGYSLTSADNARIEKLLARDGIPLPDRINLHFARARILAWAGAYDQAFGQCERGNALKRQLLQLQGKTFDSEGHARFIDRLIGVFTPAYFRRVSGFGNASPLPVFIVGMPRSGTTLVEQILASHPAVFGGGELHNMRRFISRLPEALGKAGEYPECLAAMDAKSARRLADDYLRELHKLAKGRERIADKVPMNFHQLGLIATLWPGAQVIHCTRDPRDTCCSCYLQNFHDVHFACDLGKLARYYREYERLMAHWKPVLPIPILDVRYEELVEQPEEISHNIVAFCKLPWNDACLRFYETQRTVRSSSNLQVRRPIYKSSVGAWRNYSAHLGPLLEVLDL
jgi:tetratricopeptide (TPR) repeat protein